VESAILLEVPEAEPLVEAWRLEGDVSASLGVPAHVTLLYPFVEEPDPGIIEELRFFFSGIDGFPLDFSSVGEFPEVVYLAPDQASDVAGLVEALTRRWPDHLPYGGIFDEVIPHLTVVDTPDAALRARARDAVQSGLPVHAQAVEASLWVHEDGARWQCLARFPLAPPE
jgi:hypothetical protein